MEHTYFEPGRSWHASGTYFDENGQGYPLSGTAVAAQDENGRTLEAQMAVMFDTPVSFTNTYTIQRTDNEQFLSWVSHNPALGQLGGTFTVIASHILSIYTSSNGEISGTETLIQLDENTYHNVGVSLKNGVKMSSWIALLVAEPHRGG